MCIRDSYRLVVFILPLDPKARGRTEPFNALGSEALSRAQMDAQIDRSPLGYEFRIFPPAQPYTVHPGSLVFVNLRSHKNSGLARVKQAQQPVGETVEVQTLPAHVQRNTSEDAIQRYTVSNTETGGTGE